MQFAFPLILILALGVGIVVLIWMGWSRRRRLNMLSRKAGEMGMRFSANDPFDMARRHSGFILASAGHSGRAENIIHGRYDGWHLRAFDYYFEVGHGSRRLSRRYSVIAADTDLDLGDVLMWSDDDTDNVPLIARTPTGRIGQWMVISGMEFAETVADAFSDYHDQPVDLQINNRSVIICSPVRWKPAQLAGELARAVKCLHRLKKL
ncbi:MAG: BatA domain-containing protein [Phycisphaerae bacterium]|nr:BatA domain-containing protein [Phycisphaerae bacterium]